MADRKNIFLIGRRRKDEDQLTEMLAFLWQERPETLDTWLSAVGVAPLGGEVEVETQYTIPSGKRPDIRIGSDGGAILVESKLGSGFGQTQIRDYLEYLHGVAGVRTLILLTQAPEAVPADLASLARDLDVGLLTCRWHDMGHTLAAEGEPSLAGDFVHLLIEEGLVKPKHFADGDWQAWNAGYNVALRVETFLAEIDPLVKRIDPSLKKSGNGLTARWIYRVWRHDDLEVGLGLGAAGGESLGSTSPPIIFAFVGNKASTLDEAARAVGALPEKKYEWMYDGERREWRGLFYSWPSVAREAADVLTLPTFEEQLEESATFVYATAAMFQSRGYLPAAVKIPAGAAA